MHWGCVFVVGFSGSPVGKNALLIINDLYFAPGTPISLNSSQLKDDGRESASPEWVFRRTRFSADDGFGGGVFVVGWFGWLGIVGIIC